MTSIIGIRREDKNRWERRTPIIPDHVKEISQTYGIQFIVQPSKIRVFTETEYKQAGAGINENISSCDCIFAIKEIPVDLLIPDKTLVFFSHTIKGQDYNMPMLQKILDLNCTLIDYELVKDEDGRRLIFFGNFAGMAGMIDSLWALGKRCKAEGLSTPFLQIEPAHRYPDLDHAKAAVTQAGQLIRDQGLPESLTPMVFGFAGYGNVSQGAQDIFDLMPHKIISSAELIDKQFPVDNRILYKVIFREQDMVKRVSNDNPFDLQEYYSSPELYTSRFHDYIPFLTVLMNCIFWTPKYPRLLTNNYLKKLYQNENVPSLKVIGDITCDVQGAIESTVKCTTPDQPVFVYDTEHEIAVDGVEGPGPVILAIDNLPCELPREASTYFSNSLKPFIVAIGKADYSLAYEDLELDPVIKEAIIAHQGKLTPRFTHLKKYLIG